MATMGSKLGAAALAGLATFFALAGNGLTQHSQDYRELIKAGEEANLSINARLKELEQEQDPQAQDPQGLDPQGGAIKAGQEAKVFVTTRPLSREQAVIDAPVANQWHADQTRDSAVVLEALDAYVKHQLAGPNITIGEPKSTVGKDEPLVGPKIPGGGDEPQMCDPSCRHAGFAAPDGTKARDNLTGAAHAHKNKAPAKTQ